MVPGGEQRDQGLDVRDLGVAALALAHRDVLGDDPPEPRRTQGLPHQGQPGAARYGVRTRDSLQRVRERPLAHRATRYVGGRPPGCVPRSSSRLSAVNSLMSRQARSYSAIRGATAAARSAPR